MGGNGLQVLQIGLSSCTGDELSITPEGLALVLRAANSGVGEQCGQSKGVTRRERRMFPLGAPGLCGRAYFMSSQYFNG